MANPYVAALGLAVNVGQKLIDGRTEEAFDSLNPFASSNNVLEVTIPASGQVRVPHKAGKKPNGHIAIYQSVDAVWWDYQVPDDKFFYLQTSAGTDVNLKLIVA